MYTCAYCKETISLNEFHFGVEFINGYPSPCRMNGNAAICLMDN